MFERIIGVFTLNKAVFQEIEHDVTATSQAAIVVALVALLSAIGSGIAASIGGGNFIMSFLSSFLSVFLGWLAWSAVTFFVGTTLFGGEADLNEMLRVIGFSYAPQLLGIIPCIGTLIGAIWSLVAGVIAVQEGLDFDLGKAILTVIIGWIVALAISFIIGAILGVGAAGLSVITGGM